MAYRYLLPTYVVYSGGFITPPLICPTSQATYPRTGTGPHGYFASRVCRDSSLFLETGRDRQRKNTPKVWCLFVYGACYQDALLIADGRNHSPSLAVVDGVSMKLGGMTVRVSLLCWQMVHMTCKSSISILQIDVSARPFTYVFSWTRSPWAESCLREKSKKPSIFMPLVVFWDWRLPRWKPWAKGKRAGRCPGNFVSQFMRSQKRGEVGCSLYCQWELLALTLTGRPKIVDILSGARAKDTTLTHLNSFGGASQTDANMFNFNTYPIHSPSHDAATLPTAAP